LGGKLAAMRTNAGQTNVVRPTSPDLLAVAASNIIFFERGTAPTLSIKATTEKFLSSLSHSDLGNWSNFLFS
jgi:hypothetical protein